MLEGEMNFDLNKYLNIWKNKNCINDNHHIIIETIGDWSPDRNRNTLLKI